MPLTFVIVHAGLPVMNSLSFCLSENVFILLSYLEGIFTEYRIPG